MKQPERKQLAEGDHDLIIEQVLIQMGKVTIIHKPLHQSDCSNVLRTFLQNTEKLGRFMQEVTGKQVLVLQESHKSLLIGKCLRAQIAKAKNPKYVNLVKVVRVYETISEVTETKSYIFNTVSPVTRLEPRCFVETTKPPKEKRELRNA